MAATVSPPFRRVPSPSPSPPNSGLREPRDRREPRAPFCELLSVKELIKGIESGAGSVLDGGVGGGRSCPLPPGSARYSPRYSPRYSLARPRGPGGGGRRCGDTSPQLQAKHARTINIYIYVSTPTLCTHTVHVFYFCIYIYAYCIEFTHILYIELHARHIYTSMLYTLILPIHAHYACACIIVMCTHYAHTFRMDSVYACNINIHKYSTCTNI